MIFPFTFLVKALGWVLPILGVALLLSEFVAVVTGLLMMITLPWREILQNTEAQLRLVLALGAMTLVMVQFTLVSYLLNTYPSAEEPLEENEASPIFVLPPTAFFPSAERKPRRRKKKEA